MWVNAFGPSRYNQIVGEQSIMKRSCAVYALTFMAVAIIGNHQALSEKEVGFQSGSISLKGYIVTTKGNGPLPAVIFMHGGGDRVSEAILKGRLKRLPRLDLSGLLGSEAKIRHWPETFKRRSPRLTT